MLQEYNSLEILNYQEEKEIQIISLMVKIYGTWKSIDYWNWKYKGNTAGFFPDLITLAFVSKTLAGHYTVIPTKALVDGKEIMFAQSVDTATNPEYRRKGIFETIAQRTFENASKLQIPVIYGVAGVGPSYYGFLNKLNWSHVFFFSHFIKIFNYRDVLKGYIKNSVLVSIGEFLLKLLHLGLPRIQNIPVVIKEVNQFPELINEFYATLAKEYKFILKKDQEYLNYRIKKPDGKYEIFLAQENGNIVGCAVISISKKTFKKVTLNNIAIISELIALKGKEYVVESLLIYLSKLYQNRKLDAIAFSIPEFHKYKEILRKNGFFKMKSKTGFILFENYKHPKINTDELLNGMNWHFTHLDTDHV